MTRYDFRPFQRIHADLRPASDLKDETTGEHCYPSVSDLLEELPARLNDLVTESLPSYTAKRQYRICPETAFPKSALRLRCRLYATRPSRRNTGIPEVHELAAVITWNQEPELFNTAYLLTLYDESSAITNRNGACPVLSFIPDSATIRDRYRRLIRRA